MAPTSNKNMNPPLFGKALTFSLTSASMLGSVHGATFLATIDGIDYSYTGHQSAYVVTMGANDHPDLEEGGIYYALCLDFDKNSYWNENGDSDVSNYSIGGSDPGDDQVFSDLGISATWDNVPTQNDAVAIAQLGYLVDNFFVEKFVNGDSTERAAFGQAIWEIAYDGGRTANASNDLDFRNDDFSRGNSGSFANGTTLYNEMSAMLSAVEAANPQTHTWVTEKFLIFQDNDDDQDYLLLRVAPIPEPSTALISLLGLGMALRRRR